MLVVDTADIGLSIHARSVMTELLGRAAERLAAVGDYAGAAKAEMLVGFRHWNEARTDEAIAARARAHELVDRAEPSPTVALVMSRLAINSMLQGEYQETLDLCERAEASWPSGSASRRSAAHVLNTKGVTRVNHGDLGGIADAEESIAHRRAPELGRGDDPRIQELRQHADGAGRPAPRDRARAARRRRGAPVRRRVPGDVVRDRARHPRVLGGRLGRRRRRVRPPRCLGRAPSGRTTWRPPLTATGRSCGRRAAIMEARAQRHRGRARHSPAARASPSRCSRRSPTPRSSRPSTGAHDAPRRVAELFDEAVGGCRRPTSAARTAWPSSPSPSP